MKLTIQGNFQKSEAGRWEAIVPILSLRYENAKLAETLKGVCDELKRAINDPDFDCCYTVTNDQVFFLEVPNTPIIVEYLALKMAEWQNPAEWEAEMRQSVGHRNDFEE